MSLFNEWQTNIHYSCLLMNDSSSDRVDGMIVNVNRPPKILLIVESEPDIEAISSTLQNFSSAIKIEKLKPFDNLKASYEPGKYDAVLCDFKLSRYDGIDILFFVKDCDPDVPFIFLSDEGCEDEVMDMMILNGASDYICKTNTKRLLAVVRKEVHRYRHLLRTKEKLSNSELKYRSLVESIRGIVREVDLETGKLVQVSSRGDDVLGYPDDTWFEPRFWENTILAEDRNFALKGFKKAIREGGSHVIEYRMVNAAGHPVWIRDLVSIKHHGKKPIRLDSLMIDITPEKIIEKERDQAIDNEKYRMREQKCLWNITRLDDSNLTIPQLFQRALMYIPIGFRYPHILGASIRFGDEEFLNDNYQDSKISYTATMEGLRDSAFSISVVYPDEARFQQESSAFLSDEKHLLNTILDVLSIKIEKKLTKDDLKKHERLLINTYELAQLGRAI